jgi:hypothetical protein
MDVPRSPKAMRHGTAFLVESLVMLLVLICCLAVVVGLVSTAWHASEDASRRESAVELASDCAERFSADPTGVSGTTSSDGLELTCSVTPTDTGSGVLYEADIVVSADSREIYSLTTSRYVGGAS